MFKLLIGIVLIVFLIAIGPLATIWAMNTLFPTLAIPYTFSTWAAVVIVGAFTRAQVSVKR